MIRLSGISGTKATITIALLSLLDKDRFQISPAGMSKLNLTEGSKVDVGANPEDNNALYIACVTKGRSVSKTGKVQSEQIYSWLVDNPKGVEGQFEITDETVIFDDIVWHKLAIFEGSTPSSNAATNVEELPKVDVKAEEIDATTMDRKVPEAPEAAVRADVEIVETDNF